jgi:hypothetical protein
MSSSGEVKSIINLYDSGEQVTGLEETTYSDTITTPLNNISIAIDAVDQVIPVTNKGTIKEIRIFTDYTDDVVLTCKINGQSKVWDINPVQVFTEHITSLTVSSADSENTRVLDVEIDSIL